MKTRRSLATTVALFSLAIFSMLWIGRSGRIAEAAPALAIRGGKLPQQDDDLPRPPAPPSWRDELDWSRVREDGGGYVQVLKDGGRAELTIDPRLQHEVERVLAGERSPYAAVVLLSVDDGRVLAMAGRSHAEPELDAGDLALKPWAPAASIFKLVTASALIEGGVGPQSRVCYHDGVHSVEASNLRSYPRLDRDCRSLAFGVAKSQNAIIARLANDHLSPLALARTAHALGFGQPLPLELPVAPSEAQVPAAHGLEFARVSAGFWSTTLSPLHGAYLAATLARGGVTPPLRLVDRVVDRDGNAQRPDAAMAERVISEDAARAVGQMMVGTTEYGTARLGFHDRRSGRPLLPGVAVAGKTGSLNRAAPFLAYSWFVGFAPAERPEVAIAVLLGNGQDWHKKAHQVAAEVLTGYFHGVPSLRLAAR
ncbi:MAG TPA: penicillin-binding transpeptidase domain-containing protein [Polyangia bacterium]|nr:penicillin-binding transpeptidase domain-containing protein [Polyangia bacterium]